MRQIKNTITGEIIEVDDEERKRLIEQGLLIPKEEAQATGQDDDMAHVLNVIMQSEEAGQAPGQEQMQGAGGYELGLEPPARP